MVGTVRSWIYHQRTSSRGRKLRIIWGGGGGDDPPTRRSLRHGAEEAEGEAPLINKRD